MFDVIKGMMKGIVKDRVTISFKGIKCDNSKCDFEDMSVNIEDYPDWLNRPCPKCGSNLLTDVDFEAIKRMIQIFPLTHEVKGPYSVDLEMDGSGKVGFGKTKKVKK